MGWTGLAVFELVKGGTAVFKTTSQFTALNLLLAGVLVEGAFRDAKIIGSLRVLEPRIVDRFRRSWSADERKRARARRGCCEILQERHNWFRVTWEDQETSEDLRRFGLIDLGFLRVRASMSLLGSCLAYIVDAHRFQRSQRS